MCSPIRWRRCWPTTTSRAWHKTRKCRGAPCGRPVFSHRVRGQRMGATTRDTPAGSRLRPHNPHAVVVAVGDVDVAVGVHIRPVRPVHRSLVGRPAVALATQPSARDGGDVTCAASMRRMAWFSVSTTSTFPAWSQRMALGPPQVAIKAGPPSPHSRTPQFLPRSTSRRWHRPCGCRCPHARRCRCSLHRPCRQPGRPGCSPQ